MEDSTFKPSQYSRTNTSDQRLKVDMFNEKVSVGSHSFKPDVSMIRTKYDSSCINSSIPTTENGLSGTSVRVSHKQGAQLASTDSRWSRFIEIGDLDNENED